MPGHRYVRRILAVVAAAGILYHHAAYAQAISFVDATSSAGVRTAGVANGVAVHDYDHDGWDDIFVATLSGRSTLFRNNGDGTFEDATVAAGLGGIGAYAVALWGDVDRDGIADLFLGRAGSGASRVYRRKGDGSFEDITELSGINPTLSIATAAFGDVDRDGAADLFLAVRDGADVLYRNTDGRSGHIFEDVSSLAGIGGAAHAPSMQVTWADIEDDGDLDLFAVHDGRFQSRLYVNDGSLPMYDRAYPAGLHAYPRADVCCNMGVSWGDFDGDGKLDAYVTRIGHGGLFRNNGDGTFTDVAADRGAARNGMSWGVVWADIENDGDEDLFVVSTSGYDRTPTLLYRNDGDAFAEIGRESNASFRIDAKGLAAGDFDRNGFVDLVIASTDGRNRLLMNSSEHGGRWIKVAAGPGFDQATAVGARVEVVAGGRRHIRDVSGGHSYASQSSSTVHVGLGETAHVDTLFVRWSDGGVFLATNLAVDTTYAVMPDASLYTATERGEQPSRAVFIEGVYPNPAAGVVRIRYLAARTSRVRIELYDALGRRVATVTDQETAPGSHASELNVTPLPSGVYLLRLDAAGERRVHPLIVNR